MGFTCMGAHHAPLHLPKVHGQAENASFRLKSHLDQLQLKKEHHAKALQYLLEWGSCILDASIAWNCISSTIHLCPEDTDGRLQMLAVDFRESGTDGGDVSKEKYLL
jgi:hypothetical protein